MTTGILALQGCVDPQVRMFERIGEPTLRVYRPGDLQLIDRLVLPGGESTTMLSLIDSADLWQPLVEFGKTLPVWGVCAGAILIAEKVVNPEQRSLGMARFRAHRNYYGSQLESFKATIKVDPVEREMAIDFIRAPLLEPIGGEIEVHATYRGNPVLLQHGRVIVSAFHSELGEDSSLHRYFLKL